MSKLPTQYHPRSRCPDFAELFSYGSFLRSVTLPAGADENAIKASYDKGILTVSVPIAKAAEPAEKRVAVETKK